jgi:hypothetical protein
MGRKNPLLSNDYDFRCQHLRSYVDNKILVGYTPCRCTGHVSLCFRRSSRRVAHFPPPLPTPSDKTFVWGTLKADRVRGIEQNIGVAKLGAVVVLMVFFPFSCISCTTHRLHPEETHSTLPIRLPGSRRLIHWLPTLRFCLLVYACRVCRVISLFKSVINISDASGHTHTHTHTHTNTNTHTHIHTHTHTHPHPHTHTHTHTQYKTIQRVLLRMFACVAARSAYLCERSAFSS